MSDNRKLIIGCPVKNDLESLKEMIFSLYNSTKVPFELVIIIGKGTNEETMNFLKLERDENQWLQGFGSDVPLITILNEQTETPLEAYNILFERAKLHKADLFLTQTDVVFPKLYKRDWLEQMKRIAIFEHIGAITCINGGGVSGPDYINGLEWLGGHCTYIPFRTIEKLGGYDSNFPNGFGVDIDYTYRIRLLGLNIAKINYWVDHHMMNEREHDNNPKTEQMKQESSKYFKKKYGIN